MGMYITEEIKNQVRHGVLISTYVEEIIVPDMPDYFSDYAVDFNVKAVIKCPLHGESTPSFRLYDETNTYYCWGCTSGGDVIKLHMEYMLKCREEQIGYDEAVTFLYNRYILGKNIELKNSIKNQRLRDKDLVENTSLSLMILNKTIVDIEKELRLHEDFCEDDKLWMFSLLDNVEKLVKLSRLDAKKALNELKVEYARINSIRQGVKQ